VVVQLLVCRFPSLSFPSNPLFGCQRKKKSFLQSFSREEAMQAIDQKQPESNPQRSISFPSNTPLHGPFTTDQLQQLRAQILAYKYLSRNMPLPVELLVAIRNPSVKKELLEQQSDQQVRLQRLQSIDGPDKFMANRPKHGTLILTP